MKTLFVHFVAVSAIGLAALTPAQANAQSHRQKTKNGWRNAAYASAALGALGLIKGDGTLTTLGAAGALYSASRYEHDRKSQSASDRRRAEIFRRGWYTSHGHKYVKKTVWKNHHKYYRFVRA